ncbi:RmlC-like cupin domain-containing protein [Kalaharituber pfeilii]|nr:RmlC-like cupin domain-containing protein [Kalaharituber pfeilii]
MMRTSITLALLALATKAFCAPVISLEATKTYEVSGSLLGPTSLRGYDSSYPFPTENTHPDHIDFAPGQEKDVPEGRPLDLESVDDPQPIRGSRGGTIASNHNEVLEKQHPDSFAPPVTDHGSVQQMEWPLGLSHVKLGKGNAGWSRQQNINVLPVAKEMAGVNMRLEAGGYRELHWHTAGEWALMLNGSARIQAVTPEGQTFIDDVSKGDVWFFPSGIPHSIQGLENGTEFMLIFDDGAFSEDNTFLVSETFALTPKEALARNFQVSTDAFKDIPEGELFIFPGTEAPKDIAEQNVTGPAGVISSKDSYSYHWSQQKPVIAPGGTVKIIDSNTFPIASNFAAALVTIQPGAIREIHWHPESDEWNFFISGKARITVYAAQNNARTFDYQEGDVGYIPKSMTHYIENTGTEDVVVLEVLQAPRFSDISLGQWLALTPAQVVKDTLHLSDDTIRNLSKDKPLVVPGPVPPNTVE